MSNDDNFFPKHTPGNGRLRALIDSLNEDQEQLNNNPLYKEGWDEGYQQGKAEAENNARRLIKKLIDLYS
jgi:flagellar biosynthesis/type III secretory pathway protein FliH